MKSINHLHRMASLLLVLILLGFTIGCQQQTGRSEEEVRADAERTLEMWNAGDPTGFDEFYSPDIVRHRVDIGDDLVGIEALKADYMSTRTAYPDGQMTYDKLIVKDDWVVIQFTFTATQTGHRDASMPSGNLPPTGKQVSFSGVNIAREVDGKTVEEWVYYNMSAIFTQLGYTITPPSVEGEE